MKKLIKITTSIILVLLIALNGMAVFALSGEVTTSGSSTTDSGLPLADYSEVNKYYGRVPSVCVICVFPDYSSPEYTYGSLERYRNAERQVVFNLDITHQAEVDMMAARLKVAFEGLVYSANFYNLKVALYSIPSELSIYTSESVNNLMEVRDDILYSSPYFDGYSAAQQSEVDRLTQRLVDAINALVLKKTELEPLLSSLTVVDKQHKWIYGLSEGVKNLDQYVNAPSGNMIYHPTENGFGTGTKVDFVVNNKVVNTYAIVIFGDISGDGVIDAFDQSGLTSVANFEMQFDDVSSYQLASDINEDGTVDVYDLTLLTSAVNFEMTIDQRGVVNN